MTPQERQKPEMINVSRKQRIAKGCGLPTEEVTAFLKQFEMMRQMMQGMTKFTSNMKKNPIATQNMMRSMYNQHKKAGKSKKRRR